MTSLAVAPARPREGAERHQTLLVAHQRLMMLLLLFIFGSLVIVARIIGFGLFADDPGIIAARIAARGDIVDRNGQVLAQTIDAWSIGIHANVLLTRPEDLAPKLAALMPERSEAEYLAILKSKTRFTYLRRRALPELVAQVNALGEPAIEFAREPQRLYPQGSLATHVLGYADFEGRGATGLERVFDERLRDPAMKGHPLQLALDVRVQGVLEAELADAMTKQQAVGATGLVMDVHTGEIIAMVSLPTYNPNLPSSAGGANDDRRRNNLTQSVYELGSTFKPLTVANAIDSGTIMSMATRYNASANLHVGGFTIHDDEPGRWYTVPEVLIHSSNIATAQIADQLGKDRMEGMFRRLHFDGPPDIELKERGHPIWPTFWARTTVMTTGYGHGIAITPLQLATAYAALVNGGVWRPATLMKLSPDKVPQGSRVFSQAASDRMRQLLRMVVQYGTGKFANADGLRVGGKTGTAERPTHGGYSKTLQVTTFAAAFPMDAPKYVVLTMLDSPKGSAESYGVRTAAYTSAPVAGKVIARIGPMLGIRPDNGRDIDTSDLLPLVAKAQAALAAQ
ncbi:Peptidoglycan synthase FtsI [Sphingomonas antarctica]|uniref:peptidoglycan D,D-transpeptidase FtsI family protein n=1 Tax=Sphingomonas antarctica TaxID=2040274 RepID=UPI0039E7ED3B